MKCEWYSDAQFNYQIVNSVFITNGVLNPNFSNLTGWNVSSDIVYQLATVLSCDIDSNGGGEPLFNNLEIKVIDDQGLIMYRGFSTNYTNFEQSISNHGLFDSYDDIIRFKWRAYPQYPSKALFPPIMLDDEIYYISALESGTSAQEVMAVAGRNVANMVVSKIESFLFG